MANVKDRTAAEVATMGSLTVKAFCRRRDGWRCVECGLSNDEHILTYRSQLQVHRIIPGCVYHPALCETLCKPCHGTRSKSVREVLADPSRFGVTPEQLAAYTPAERDGKFVMRVDAHYHALLKKISRHRRVPIWWALATAIENEARRLGIPLDPS